MLCFQTCFSMTYILSMSLRVLNNRLVNRKFIIDYAQTFLEYCSAVKCSVADSHLKQRNIVMSGASELVMYFSVTLHIVDMWRYYVCCIRPDVTRCLLIVLLYHNQW